MRPVERFFDNYGRTVARRPLPFLIVPIVATLVCSIGLLNFRSEDDIWDIYSPLNAASRREEKELERFEHASGSKHYRIQIIIDRKDSGNLLDAAIMEEIGDMHQFVIENTTVTNKGGETFHYRDFCGVYCNDSNSIVIGFLSAIAKLDRPTASLRLTYPNAHAIHRNLFLGYSIGNLTYAKNADIGEIVTEFRLFILHYFVDIRTPIGQQISRDFETKLRRLFADASRESSMLNFAILSRNRELEEQRQITLVALPYLGVTAIILTFFMLATLFNYPLYKSQHIEGLIGVISPTMAFVTTVGLLWMLDYPFSNILTVVPFLVITIGIDDAFLILAGWRHSNSNADFESRMGECMAKSGASVTVTSVTDVLCFAVGFFSNLPVVRFFCIYTSLALAIDYIYQMTFFTAIVAYCGRRQIRREEKMRFLTSNLRSIQQSTHMVGEIYGGKNVENTAGGGIFSIIRIFPSQQFDDNNNSSRAIASGFLDETNQPNKTNDDNSDRKSASKRVTSTTFLSRFVLSLQSSYLRGLIFAIFTAHIILSTYLCTQVNTDFSMENLYLKNSPLNAISIKMQHFVLNDAFIVNFGLLSMPDFAQVAVRTRFNEMIDELERLPSFGIGPTGTNLWTREFANAIGFWGDEEEFWRAENLWKNYRDFGMDEKYVSVSSDKSKNVTVIDGFYWSITYQHLRNFLDVQQLMRVRRETIAKYANDFNVTSHHPLEKVPAESAASAPDNFIQTSGCAVLLMSVLVFIFILDFSAIFSVVLSIFSICAGTVGYLHLWNVHLDAVSLISMLMSIGFSVDYSAHICYHFFTHQSEQPAPDVPCSSSATSGSSSAADMTTITSSSMQIIQPTANASSDISARLESTFNAVAWPVLQSGLSTVLGMIPLVLVDAYVVAVFWKTVLLVTMLGIFHALFVLPCVFVTVEQLTPKRKCNQQSTTS